MGGVAPPVYPGAQWVGYSQWTWGIRFQGMFNCFRQCGVASIGEMYRDLPVGQRARHNHRRGGIWAEVPTPIWAEWGFELGFPRDQLSAQPLGSPGSPSSTAGIDKEGLTQFGYRTPSEGLPAVDPKQSWMSLCRWDLGAKLWGRGKV